VGGDARFVLRAGYTAMSEWVTTRPKRPDWLTRDEDASAPDALCLVILWSAEEPERVGEVAFIGGETLVLGRGGTSSEDPTERARFLRRRGASWQPTEPLTGSGISRRQCLLRATPEHIEVEQVGRCALRIDGLRADGGLLGVGRTLTLRDQLVLFCTRRPAQLALRHYSASDAPNFGDPDADGIVGESAAAWELREQLAFAAGSNQHVLLLGESGSGKELSARALHRMSPRGSRPLVARNAATFPATLIDAELFGNAANYPNTGMPARPGLVGEADHSRLLLDEFAELPLELQPHLLRVLDAHGEYQRLGDARTFRSDFLLVAATNRDPTELRHDVLSRLPIQVQVPSLRDRPEDVPLLVRHVLRRAAANGDGDVGRFLAEGTGGPHPRLDPDLIEALVLHPYTGHVRELEGWLWKAIADSPGAYIALPNRLRDALGGARAVETASRRPSRNSDPTPEEILACLNRNGSHVGRAASELGLPSRYALYRLIRKHGLAIERAS
jgi:DNA-binding NtrC family response regulator